MGTGKAGLVAPVPAVGPRHPFARHLRTAVRTDRFQSVRGRFPALGEWRCPSSGRGDRPPRRVDGKTSRRSGGVDATALHLVSAFAAGAGLVLGQRATAAKSNEKTAIPELLSTLALEGCTVTIDAMGTQANIAQAILDRGADYVLAVKDNQPKLAESIQDFWTSFSAHPATHTPHRFTESVEKGHGRIETRRCTVFD